MGLAAGQARLLSITARLSDNEHSSQSLAYAKQRLADSAQQITTEYNEALDATKLTVLTGFNGSVPNYTDISYGLMTGLNTVACGKQYVVTDAKGRILLPQTTADAFENSHGSINDFLAAMSVNGKTNFSQVDIDVNAEDANDKVTAAWDKYFNSVGVSYANDPDITSFEYVMDGNTVLPCVRTTVQKPVEYLTATLVNDNGRGGSFIPGIPAGVTLELTQAFQNIDADGNKLVNSGYLVNYSAIPMDLAVAGGGITPSTAKYEYDSIYYVEGGNLSDVKNIENESGTVETPAWTFEYNGETYMMSTKPWLDKNNKVLYNNEGKYPLEYYFYKYDYTRNAWLGYFNKTTQEYEISDSDGKTGTNVMTATGRQDVDSVAETNVQSMVTGIETNVYDVITQTETLPINFDGTTQEQRELYDYAMALTKAVANKDSFGTVNSIAKDPENTDAVNYLKNIFYQMQTFGYVTSEDAFHLTEADTLHDNKWFEEQLKKGKLFLKSYSASEKTFMPTTLSDDSAIQEVEDERKIAMAEAKYTQDMEQLEREDQKFDLELKKLDTEHNALQTEYDALKSVVDKNIEKAFNAFS